MDTQTRSVVLEGQLAAKELGRCSYLVADFSLLTRPGTYRVHCDKLASAAFEIAADPYAFLLPLQLDFIEGMRCGCATRFHGPCHLDDLTLKGKHYPCPGGYHDACDLRRFMQNPRSACICIWLRAKPNSGNMP